MFSSTKWARDKHNRIINDEIFIGKCTEINLGLENLVKNSRYESVQSNYVDNKIQSEAILKLHEKLEKENLVNSQINIRITLDNKIKILYRRRVMNTFTGMFLKADYQQRLSSKLAEICDECTINFILLTKDLL